MYSSLAKCGKVFANAVSQETDAFGGFLKYVLMAKQRIVPVSFFFLIYVAGVA